MGGLTHGLRPTTERRGARWAGEAGQLERARRGREMGLARRGGMSSKRVGLDRAAVNAKETSERLCSRL